MGDIKFYSPVDFDDTSSGVTIEGNLVANAHVGIGVASPNNTLDIDSSYTNSVHIQGTGSYNLYSYHDSGGVGWATGSGTSWNNLLYLDATNNSFRVYTSGAEKMCVTSGGNVGIGTTAPGSKLHINSTGEPLRFTRTGQEEYRIIHGTSGLYFSHPNSGALLLGLTQNGDITVSNDQSAEYVRFDNSSSNVGIGTNSPSQKLEVVSNTTYDGIQIKGSSIPTLGIIDTTNNAKFVAYVRDSDATIGMETNHPLTINTNNTERMRIDSSGNVGIGTTSPTVKLVVDETVTNSLTVAHFKHQQAAVVSNVLFENAAGADNTGFNLNFKTAASGYGGVLGVIRTNLPSAGSADMFLSSSGGEAIRILSSGNVGIGTTAPTSLLEISQQLSGASTIDYPYIISSRDDGNTVNQVGGEGVGIKFRIAGNASATPGDSLVGASIAAIRESGSDTDSSTGLGFFVTQNDETLDEALRIDHDGNVGIGTTSPQQKLHVEGNIYLGPNNTNNFIHSGAHLGLQADGEVKIVSDVNDSSGVAGSDIVFGYGSSTNTDSNQNFTEAELGTYPRVEVMRIDASTNRVGIGTISPGTKLDVSGVITATGGNSTNWNTAYGWGNHASAGYLPLAGGTLTGALNASSGLYFVGDSSMGFVPYPIGGQLRSNSSAATGYIKIKLPTDIGNSPDDMISFYVDIYDYTTNEMISVFVGGYTYRTTSTSTYWYNCTAIINTKQISKDFTVRFGNDGTNFYVSIGEANSVWAHPSVVVRDFQCSFQSNVSHYVDNWNVSIDSTSLVGVDETQTGNLPKASGAPYSGLSGTVPTWNQNTTGNAGSSTVLQTARTIAGVSFNGSANISLNNNAITNGAGYTNDQTPAEILTAIKTVDGAGSGLDADLLDGYHESSFIRIAATSSNPNNAAFAIGTASSRNFIQSHNGRPLDINPLGNAVTVGSSLSTSGDLTVSGGDIILGGTGRIQGIDTVSASTDAANKTYVDTAVSNLVDSAPSTLDTLNELAAALGDDPNFATTVTNSIAAKLPLAGGDMTGQTTHGDSIHTYWGNSNDLDIYHDNTFGSIIRDRGAGDLGIESNQAIRFRKSSTTELMTLMVPDGAVSLYYDNSKKFETTSTGVTVTGNLDSPQISVNDYISHNGDSNTYFGFPTADTINLTTAGAERMRITSTGNVGIGTTGPTFKLHVNSTDASDNVAYIHHNNAAQSSGDVLKVRSDAGDNAGSALLNVANNTGTALYVRGDRNVGIGTTSPTYKLTVSGGMTAGGKTTYTKSAGSLDTTGYDVAGLSASYNGQSACFTFTCSGHSGGYQKIVYSCYNAGGTWIPKKVINEGTNQLDVVASANGTTITFTFRSISGTLNYTPRVTVEAVGTAIISTYA